MLFYGDAVGKATNFVAMAQESDGYWLITSTGSRFLPSARAAGAAKLLQGPSKFNAPIVGAIYPERGTLIGAFALCHRRARPTSSSVIPQAACERLLLSGRRPDGPGGVPCTQRHCPKIADRWHEVDACGRHSAQLRSVEQRRRGPTRAGACYHSRARPPEPIRSEPSQCSHDAQLPASCLGRRLLLTSTSSSTEGRLSANRLLSSRTGNGSGLGIGLSACLPSHAP